MEEEDRLEVSLPGAGETESQTILEQLNQGLCARVVKTEGASVSLEENPEVGGESVLQTEVIQCEEKSDLAPNLGAEKSESVAEGSTTAELCEEVLKIATESVDEGVKEVKTEEDEVIEKIFQDPSPEEEIRIEDLLEEEIGGKSVVQECGEDFESRCNGQGEEERVVEVGVVAEGQGEEGFEDLRGASLEAAEEEEQDSHISSQIASFYDQDREDDSRPPVPIKTYRWEDVRRAKQQGGYPWTHLYKEPLGPDDEPEVIFRYRSSPKNRRSFEEKLLDSPKSEKRVRIDTEVSVQDCCYPDILDDDDDPHVTESNASEDVAEHTEHTEPSKEESVQPRRRSFRQIFSPKSILKRSVKSDRAKQSPAKKEPDTSPNRVRYCHPIVDKLKTMAEKQLSKTQGKKVKKIPLQESNKISLEEEQKILKLKDSPKAKHREITCFEERQDSDDIVEIVELDESPGEARRRRDEKKDSTSHVTPDEIIELPVQSSDVELKNQPEDQPKDQPKDDKESSDEHTEEPKKKIPRRQEHVYEDIQTPVILTGDSMDPSFLHEIIAPTDLKTSLKIQDKQLFAEVEYKRKPLEDITQSSEESQKSTTGLLAPICSVDSASSDDERKATLQAVVEESDAENTADKIPEITTSAPENEDTATDVELKSVLKTEASPSLDKRVTFSSSTEDDPDLLKEDVELAGLDANLSSRWSNMSDHEYEPIGQPVDEAARADTEDVELEGAVGGQESPVAEPSKRPASEASSITSHERKLLRVPTEEEGADDEMSVQDIQKDIEDRYFTSATPESRTDGELHTSAVDSSAIEDLPLDRGSRKKTMLTSAQDRGRQMQQKLRTQAGKLRSKLRGMKKAPNGKKDSPPAKERKKFKTPEFTKLKNIHMPKVNKPEMPKFKRPEFTKIEFKKPDFSKITLPERPSMSKLRIPERFSSLKLRRSRSMKESTGSTGDSTSGTNEPPAATKKRFDFATYPRIFDKMRKQKTVDGEKPVRPGTPPPATFATVAKTAVKKDSLAPEESVGEESADQRQDSLEEEEFHRESSLERRMRQHFMRQREESEQEQALETEEQRQMADFDKENREIHEISLARQEEFKQRPLVHQDSDLVSEESAGKWTGSLNLNQSSSLQGSEKFDFDSNTIPIEVKEPQKGVIEQIDDDEFFLRSKGISQDNIQIGEYISSAIREGLTTPMNTLAQVGRYSPYYDEDVDLNSEPIDYGYDVPKKPRRVRDRSSLEGEEFFGTYPPTKPMRKHRNYESDERIVPQTGTYYNEGENQSFYDNNMEGMDQPDMYIDDEEEQKSDMQECLPFPPTPPKAPKRRRKLHRPSPRSIPGYDNLAGRSVSNNYIPNGDTDENIIVYRTQHEYPVPLATPETFTPIPTPRSRSRSQTSRITDDDRTSHGAESLISDTHMQIQEFLRNELEITGNNGYAIVKKEPPPRPPPPRRKKTSKALGESQFATMPLPKRSVTPPTRPKRNYSTIAPSRPPRTKSTSSLGEDKPYRSPSPDLTQYEEIDDVDSYKDLQSGDIIKKMKERPLPPPPRPTRSLRRPKKDNKDDKPDDDRDGGGIRDAALNADEVEVSTQTDPLPDDFCCEEFEITSDMKTITPSQCKTLEDILKEEQEAEIERAQQLAAEQSLTRGLQRFREGNHRSLSERSKASTLDRPKTPGSRPGSRPISPNAVVVERKISTPTMLTEATLSVEPVDEPTTAELSREIQGILSQELQPVQPEMREESEVRTEILSDVASDRVSIGQEEERLEIVEATNEQRVPEPSQEVQEDVPEEVQPSQEEITRRMHDEVEAELERCAQRLEQVIDVLQQDDIPPVPPPRRKSSAGDSLIPQTSSGNLQLRDLTVDHLNVNQLQAGKLLVSELEGSSLSTQELECKSGNLVVKSLELPKGLIEEIVDRVRSQLPAAPPPPATTTTTTVHEDPELEKEPPPPTRPPPPHSYYHLPTEFYPYSLPPPSFYRLRNPSDEDEEPPSTSHRRRRHHRAHRDSSEEEEHVREPRNRSRHSSRTPDVIDLGGQFLRACSSAAGRSVRQTLQLVRAMVVKEENRNEVNVVAMLLIVLMASLVLICMGGSDKTVHHHHWDFFNAPGNGNLPK
ncbi:uncharacterized protein LOC129793017 isoform X2 [Lutzomyia longipalpis]|uniref:uncharacterized protein LOC129793017 isoform X2 n=1 Tax=Lutzomyia longipalpis TaxID=7200 RepID=UPI002483C72B|nr:uncharacterized protein LOC129793017 isoform X2 [Lutzomyia longipalpis]